MSNEPNEAEKKIVAEMDALEIWLSPQETRRQRMAEILAAHRRDDELAKALDRIAILEQGLKESLAIAEGYHVSSGETGVSRMLAIRDWCYAALNPSTFVPGKAE